jgi:transportin-3
MKKTRCYGTQSGMYTNDQRKSSLLCYERSQRPCYLTVSTYRLVPCYPQDSPIACVVLEDYIRMLMNMVEFAPDIFFESSAFPAAFHIALAALTLIHSDTIFASLDLIRMILTHDCLAPDPRKPPPPKFPLYAQTIHQTIDKEGFEFTSLLLTGLVGDFPEETASIIVTLFRVLASLWSRQLQQWAPVVLQSILVTSAPEDAKVRFMKDLDEYV